MKRLLAFCFLATLLTGCATDKQATHVTYGYWLDYSGSSKDMWRKQIGSMLAELENAPDDSNVVLYRMGSRTQEVFSGSLGDTSLDALVSAAISATATPDPTPGTNFALMAESMDALRSRHPGDDLRFRVLTDGGNDYSFDSDRRGAYFKSASSVASDPRVQSLMFLGVKPGFREELRRAFGQAQGRLGILSSDQMLDEGPGTPGPTEPQN